MELRLLFPCDRLTNWTSISTHDSSAFTIRMHSQLISTHHSDPFTIHMHSPFWSMPIANAEGSWVDMNRERIWTEGRKLWPQTGPLEWGGEESSRSNGRITRTNVSLFDTALEKTRSAHRIDENNTFRFVTDWKESFVQRFCHFANLFANLSLKDVWRGSNLLLSN
jgi:hypothetical protein